MTPDLIAQLPRSQRKAVESAGYRVMRWAAARAVLQSRVEKGRIAGPVGDFLAHWLQISMQKPSGELDLSFAHTPEHLKLVGASASFAVAPLEQALLHLPALRSFWRQELRSRHFTALRALIPQAWFLDPAVVPPGAVIQGLNTTSWEQTLSSNGPSWQMKDPEGEVRKDLPQALAARDSILVSGVPDGTKLNASYQRNVKAQVVLRAIEAAP